MSKVCQITGIGHAGTQWLAHVLDRPEQGVRFTHELAYRKTGITWLQRQKMAVEKGVAVTTFPKYWAALKETGPRWIGDSMSWHPIEVVYLAKQGVTDQIVLLVRNGIQQLHSVAYHSTWGNVGGDHWLYHTYLRRYWELAGSPGKPWEQWATWEKLCLWWATNEFCADWIRDQYKEMFVLRMEDLTRRAALLEEFIGLFGIQVHDVSALQGQDMNRKVPGDRSPGALWARWSQEQRDAFVDICGPSMAAFDYDIPEG